MILRKITVYFLINVKEIVDARVLQINNDEKTGEKQYYLHFLNFEKRMDKWIPQSLVKKNYGKLSTAIEGVNNSLSNYIVKFNQSFNS